MPTIHDVWFLRDRFLQDARNGYLEIAHTAEKDKQAVPPYIEEFFNVRFCCNPSIPSNFTTMRTINSLINAVNAKDAKQPKYLVVIIDFDII